MYNFRPYNCPHAGSECSMVGDIPYLRDDIKVEMHPGSCTFNHRYVKTDPHEVENATWMLTVITVLYSQVNLECFRISERNMALFYSGGDGEELKLIWKEPPNSDASNVTSVVNSLSLPVSFVCNVVEIMSKRRIETFSLCLCEEF
ncbi:hypothetical protein L2E82_41581 [Cichorium intybus]|uniref:Uncharacterized protein n=1 Tax=Cichorium intybus TaxID=13427 RepID=A0ACB9AND4_CICIN|nr:hypothetical protein L2E82_41581 [Cichorium intybus]